MRQKYFTDIFEEPSRWETLDQYEARTCGTSTPVSGSSRAASPAKTSRRQAAAEDLPEAGPVFGGKCSELLASFNPRSFLLKMYRALHLADLTACYLALPNSGMMLNGKLYRRHRLGHPIYANVSGLLPTPTCTDAQIGRIHKMRNKGDYYTWKNCHPLTTRIKGIVLGLIGKQSPPPERYALNPVFTEWMMGFPMDWTKL